VDTEEAKCDMKATDIADSVWSRIIQAPSPSETASCKTHSIWSRYLGIDSVTVFSAKVEVQQNIFYSRPDWTHMKLNCSYPK